MPLFKGLCGFMWDSLGPISNGGGCPSTLPTVTSSDQ